MKGYEVGDKVMIKPNLTSGYYLAGKALLFISSSKVKYKGQIHTIEKVHEEYTKELNTPVFYLKGLEGVWTPSTVLSFNSIEALLTRRINEKI